MTTTLSRSTSDTHVFSAIAGESQNVAGWCKRYAHGPDALAVMELREMLHQSEPLAHAIIGTHGPFGTELQRVRERVRDAMPGHAGGGWPEGATGGEGPPNDEHAPEPTPAEWRAIHAAADRYVSTLRMIGETLAVVEDRPPEPVQRAEPANDHPSDVADLPKESIALALLAQHGEWSNEQIAKAAGCFRTSLYRMEKFMAARKAQKAAHAGTVHRGSKGKGGELEAWE